MIFDQMKIFAAPAPFNNPAGSSITKLSNLVDIAANQFTIYLGILIFSAVIYAGFLVLSSFGDAAKLLKAKKVFLYTLIGGLLAVFSYGIIKLIFKIFG